MREYLPFQRLLALVLVFLTVPAVAAERLETDVVQRFAKWLVEELNKIDKVPLEIEADVDRAVGVKIADDTGVILVPQKGMKEDEIDMRVDSEQGAPLAVVFMSRGIRPILDEQVVAADKIGTLERTNRQGNTFQIGYLLLAVKRISDSEWRLRVFGKDEMPLLEAPFRSGAGPEDLPVAIDFHDVNDTQGKLEITVFEKYQAEIRLSKRDA